MADDIVTRLRHKYAGQLPICAEAADEIERLCALIKEYVDLSLAEWTDAWFASDDLGEKAEQAFEALKKEASRG